MTEVVVLGVNVQGTAVTCQGLIQAPHFSERVTQIGMGLGEIWFDSDGLLVAVNGLIQLPQGSEHIAKVVMGLRVIGLDGYGFVEAGHGVLKRPCSFRRKPTLLWDSLKLGLKERAFWWLSMASSRRPNA